MNYLRFVALLVFIFFSGNGHTLQANAPDSTRNWWSSSHPSCWSSQDDRVVEMLDSLVALMYYDTTGLFSTLPGTEEEMAAGSASMPSDDIIRERLARLNRMTPMGLVYNDDVKRFIEFYGVKRYAQMNRMLGLAELYFPLFEETLDKYGIPLELRYLAIVESALNPVAVSRAGAKGLWQFMYGTGKLYGLKVNSLVDERYDPHLSTDAAARHLKDLYGIFGDWSLVLAAYNAGAGNVTRAMRRAGGVPDYWAIQPYLPKETRNYVPAFIAVTYLLSHQKEHNLKPISPGIHALNIDTFVIQQPLPFASITELAGIPRETLKYLNPTFLKDIIPASADQPYLLRIPREFTAAYLTVEDTLFRHKSVSEQQREKLIAEAATSVREEARHHVVRKGENLGVIARRYGCSVNDLMKWNSMRNTHLRVGQRLTVYKPVNRPVQVAAAPKPATTSLPDTLKNQAIEEVGLSEATEKPALQESKFMLYTVRVGDTLWSIAGRYDGVSVQDLKQINNMKESHTLMPGQKIKVPVKS